jgi:hypothetical protein
MFSMRFTGLIAVGVVLAGSIGGAQATRPVDTGTFILSLAGKPIATETFTIVRNAAPGGGYVLTSTRSGGGRVMHSSLTTDSLGTPITYHHDGTGGDAATKQLNARRAPGRLTVDEIGGRGSTTDYPLGPGTLMLDDETVHQLYFVGLAGVPRVVAFISPLRRTTVEEPVTDLGHDPVIISGDTITASHLVLGAGGSLQREIWIDSQKRLLKIWIPLLQIIAIRDKPPL